MNEVGSESGTGLRAIKSSRSSDANFEYDDSEWDVGIGNLIIDLDADIEKNNEANRNNNNSTGTLSGNTPVGVTGSNNLQQMHIPLTSSNSNTKSGKSSGGSGNSSLVKGTSNTTTSSSDLSTVMEHSSIVDKGLKMKIKRTKTGTKSGADAKHEIVKNDVVGSSNGTTGGNPSSNSNYSSNKSISDSISSKNSHSSHKDKDKLLIKDGLLHDNSHENSGSINNATSAKDGEHGGGGGKVKTPRKGSTKEKKTKNSGSNVGNSGNSKKDEKNNDTNSKGLSNSGSGNSNTSSSGTHAKDNKEFFSTTVNLNVPNVIPNSSSSAFVKATATIKVPTAPSSTASSVLSSSTSGLHNVHTSGGDSSSSSSSRSQSLSGNNSSASNNNSTPWGTVSPNKGADKGRLSPSVANLSNANEKNAGNSYNKKGRAFAAATSDKSGSSQDESSTGSHGGSSSYRNSGAVGINTATDLSSSSSNFVQGAQTGNGGSFGSPKDSGKGGRNLAPATQDVCVGTSVGTVTEPDCLGPCEPGTSVTLEGIVWHETESGVLVVNVTWRGKTYVGTLIDCTKNDWAPPRFCDSPVSSDLEMRTPKNRGKRGRAQAATPVNEPVVADTRSANAKLRNGAKGRRGSNTNAAFVAPASPVKADPWPKRKTRGSENESQEEVTPKNAKRLKVSKDGDRKERRSNSPAADNEKSGPSSPQLIECPEPNCSKKYTHMNGLRYHLTHAHSNNLITQEDSDSNLSTASNTNTPAQPETSTNNASDTAEPMVVDGPEVSENSNSSTKNATSNAISEEPLSVSAPPTPGKKPNSTTSSTPKVDDKIYDLSSDADLNLNKDSNSNQEGPEPYSKSVKGAAAAAGNKSQPLAKDISNDVDSKLAPENLSKDSASVSTTSSSSPASSTPTTSAPTLTPRTPILTVPVVPSYMSLQNRNLVHRDVVNVPRVEPREPSEGNGSPMKNTTSQGSTPSSKNAPWQPHAQTGLSPHLINTSPPSQSINVPLNIPMNISEKLGGSSAKDKDKNGNSPDQASKKNKHKKKSKDREKDREGKSKDKDKQDLGNKSLNIPMAGGPSDYSRSSGMFHNSNIGADRSKEVGSGDDNDSSRKSSVENRDDPQSPAYSDISDANDSGPDADLNVGTTLKDPNCKGLVIPGEIKKDPIGVPGVAAAGPPFQFFNHNLHSPYLDSLSYAARQQNKDGPAPPTIPNNPPEEPEKNRLGGPIKHPGIPTNPQGPSTSTVGPAGGPGEDARRSPKMDFSKYPYPNYFSYPYPGYHPYENPPFPNSLPPSENSFNPPGQGRMFPGMEDREKESAPGKGDKLGEKDEGPGSVQIKQEPMEREERRVKESRSLPSGHPMNVDDKPVEVKREFGSEHNEPKLVPPYMQNSSSKHGPKDHSKRDDRHDRRHESKDLDSKSEKLGRNSSSNSDKNKGAEESEPKERKDEGAKPTMETTGPPPPPTASAYYLAQSYLPTSHPFSIPFDPGHPLYRQMLVHGGYPGNPYMHPGALPRFPSPGGPTPLPEDLSRPNPGGPPASKALDILQHHAAQYYNSHKIHELQERALKSPSPQVAAAQRAERDGPPSSTGGPGGPPTASSPGHPLGGPGNVPNSVGGGRSSVGGTSSSSSMPKPADLSKDSKPTIGPGGTLLPGGPNSDNVRTPPPTQHHVHSHTHHHTHVGLPYPIIPTVPPQYSPHYGVLAATPPAAPSVIPPFPAQKPN